MPLTADDRAAIHDLINLHGHLVDRGDFAALSALFTEDVTYDASAFGSGTMPGLAAIREASLSLGEGNPLAHHVTNTVLTETPDGTVQAVSKGLGVMTDGSTTSVTYEDRVERRETGWRITHRVIRPRRTPLQP